MIVINMAKNDIPQEQVNKQQTTHLLDVICVDDSEFYIKTFWFAHDIYKYVL